jgi:hypothetical protein
MEKTVTFHVERPSPARLGPLFRIYALLTPVRAILELVDRTLHWHRELIWNDPLSRARRPGWGVLRLGLETNLRRRTRVPTVASTTSHADIRGLRRGAEPQDSSSSGGAAV